MQNSTTSNFIGVINGAGESKSLKDAQMVAINEYNELINNMKTLIASL